MTDYNDFNVTNRGNENGRRRRKRRKSNMITPLLFFFFCLTAIATTAILKHSFNRTKNNPGGDNSRGKNIIELVAKGGKDIIDTISSTDEVAEFKEKNYPNSLIKLYKRNKEARDFVKGYDEHIGKDVDYEGYVYNDEGIDISKDMKDLKEGDIPLFMQWDKRWGYSKYGDDFMALTGCGPASLSMVYCGLTKDSSLDPYTIARQAEEEGYYVDGSGTAWNMMTELASEIGLNAMNISADRDVILERLENNNPIICIMGPGDFTNSGHFIVLTGVEEDGFVRVNDPNSIKNSEKSWDLDSIIPQMKNLWSYEYDESDMSEDYMDDYEFIDEK